jgi:hypothetical protein
MCVRAFFVSNIAIKVLQNQLMPSVLPPVCTADEIQLHVRTIR